MYFVLKGRILLSVYDWWKDTLIPFQILEKGSSVNVINTILGFESIFVVETLEPSILLGIDKEDVDKVAKDNPLLFDEL